MYRYRWLLLTALAASAVIFGAAYSPSPTSVPPRAVAAPSFNVAQRHLTGIVKNLRVGIAALPGLGLPRAAGSTDADLRRQATALMRSIASMTSMLRRSSVRG